MADRVSLSNRMQEKLDGLLSEQEEEELLAHLDEDEEAAEVYAQLERLDWMLTTAPHVRAPQRLAATIMARLSQTLETEADLESVPEEARQAILLSMSLVSMSTMPMMLAASWLVLNQRADPELLTRVIYRVIALLAMIIDALAILLEEIEKIVHDDPEMAAAAVSLLPMVMTNILDYMEGKYQEENVI